MSDLLVSFQPDLVVSGVRERVKEVFEEVFNKNLYLESDCQIIKQTLAALSEETQNQVKEQGGIRQYLMASEMGGTFSEVEGIMFMTRDSGIIKNNVLDFYPTKEVNGQLSPTSEKPRIISEVTKKALCAELSHPNPRAPQTKRVTFRDTFRDTSQKSNQFMTSRANKVPLRSLSSCVSAAPFFPKEHRPPNPPFYHTPLSPVSPPFQPSQPVAQMFQPSQPLYQQSDPQVMTSLFGPRTTSAPIFSSVHPEVWTVPGPSPEGIVESVLKGDGRTNLKDQLKERELEVKRMEGRIELLEREGRVREENLVQLRNLLTETQAQLNETQNQLSEVRVQLGEARDRTESAQRELDEVERERKASSERALLAEKRVLSFHRDRAVDGLKLEIAELDKLVKWTELNPNTKAHALQLRAHIISVQELTRSVSEQFQRQLEELDRGQPLSKLAYISSEIPPRPLPPVYLPTEREYPLPYATSPPPTPDPGAGFAQPRYGPQTVSWHPGVTGDAGVTGITGGAGGAKGTLDDAQTRLVRKLSNWHPELTETELFGYISRAKLERPGQSFLGMSLNEILSSVHDVISRERQYGPKKPD